MRKIILIAALAVCGFVSAAPKVAGVYRLEGEKRLVLTASGQAATREGNTFRHYGSWTIERVDGHERVVMRLRNKDEWQAEMLPKVWLLDILPDGKGLLPRGVGNGTLLAAVECMKAQRDVKEQPPVFSPVRGAYNDGVAKEVEEAIFIVDAPVRERDAARRREASVERMKKNPKLLRSMSFAYPKVDPEESVPDANTRHMLYSPEMQELFEVLMDTYTPIDKETLEIMLDRVDWKKGETLAFRILGRKELDAAALRKYAPKVLDRIGKTDRYFLCLYFEHRNLPEDVKEAALKKGWSR